MEKGEALSLSIRYILLLLFAIGNLYIIYLIATPATINASFFFIKKIYPEALLLGDTIFFKGYYASIVSACVAGAAYYLLLILNFTTPMGIKKRISSLFFLLISFFLINIARIVFFARLFDKGYNYFDLTHIAVWYIGSTLLVVFLWGIAVFLFSIEGIPVYSDFISLLKETKNKNL